MGAKILAVDDEEGILRLLKRALERDGAEVDTVSDPMRIMTGEVNPDRYDLILLDVMMPGIDGFTLLNGMRDRIDCPVLFLTAKTSEEDLMRGFGLGADDYIRKPFGIGELRARVQAHIRRERREKKHAVTVGNLRFYLREKQIEYGEQEILLTPGEYEICEYLALHRGQVFSREQIYEHVYGYDKDGDESAVTEYVKNIRAKFRKLGLAPVETVWGIGYRWTTGVEKGNGR